MYPRLTARLDEPIRCSLIHTSLTNHTSDYLAWESEADPDLQLHKKLRAWWSHQIDLFPGEQAISQLCRFQWGDYLALSYAWGSDLLSSQVIVDGRYVPITDSLHSALLAVREDPRVIMMQVSVWVDALCINQDDLVERSKEIKTMRNIFGDSMGVFVHLGPASEDTHLALKLIRLISYNIKQGFGYGSFLLNLGIDVTNGEREDEKRSYIALMKLLCRPYWTRLWIIQELAVGDDEIAIHCGNDYVFLHQVRQVLRLLILNAASFGMIITSDVYERYLVPFQTVTGLLWWVGYLRQLTLRSESRHFLTYKELRSPILTLAQYATATDPRDKIFGIVGILPTSITSRIDTNPLLSVRDVYVNFAKAVMDVTVSLDLIFARNLEQDALSTLGLPSWVTDWTLAPDRTGIFVATEWNFVCDVTGYEACDEAYGIVKRATTTNFKGVRADGCRSPQIRFMRNDELLLCEGFCIGEIDGIATGVSASIGTAGTSKPLIQPQNACSPYGDTPAVVEALLRTWMFDPSGEGSKNSALFQFPWFGGEEESFNEEGNWEANMRDLEAIGTLRGKGWEPSVPGGSFFLFEQFRRALGHFRVGDRPIKDYFPQELVPCPPGVNLSHDFEVVAANSMCRSLVTMNTGHVGFAPTNVQRKDKVFVLIGCSIPVILRRDETGDYYKVVAECYMDGFMTGEAFEALDTGKYQLQTITLC